MPGTLSVKFFLLPRELQQEKANIYLRLIVDRQKAELNTSLGVKVSEWNEEKQRTQKDKRINEELSFIEQRFQQIRREMLYAGEELTAKALKHRYLNQRKPVLGLLAYFAEIIPELKRQPQRYTLGTIRIYSATLKHLQTYLKGRDVPLTSIDKSWVNGFDNYLAGLKFGEGLIKVNTIHKHHVRMKAMLSRAVQAGLITRNPYESFKLKTERSNRTFLADDELQRLKSCELSKKQERVRDFFLFSVYSGLRFTDASSLEVKHLKRDAQGRQWLELEQHKTGDKLFIPLLQQAVDILAKYEKSAERAITGKLLPVISNDMVNIHLRAIASIAKIDKPLTHHVARHTFATTVTLSNHIPIEIVSRLLGHRDLKTTQLYAKITQQYLGEIADQLDEKLKRLT